MSELQLTTADATEYQSCKHVIKDGFATCLVVGWAMHKIKERGWFRAEGYADWDEFMAGEYGWTGRYGNQLIVDAKVINSLPESMRKLVTSHKAAQALSEIPELLRPEVLEKAVKFVPPGKPVTAPAIRAAAPPPPARPAPGSKAAAKPPGRPATGPVDEMGMEVPQEILPLWLRSEEVEELLTYVQSVRRRVGQAMEDHDPLFAEVDFKSFSASLGHVTDDLLCARPYAVCPECHGKLADECDVCGQRGFISKVKWEGLKK